jgi:hypothetical protein
MARKRKNAAALTTRDFELTDARHVAKGLKKHEAALEAAGVTEADVSDFEGVITRASAHNKIGEIVAQVALDQQRLDVRQRLGTFRRWADVVVTRPTGIDTVAAKALKVDVAFPNDDAELVTFMKGLEPGMKKYSA